jgi:hypothetical protein
MTKMVAIPKVGDTVECIDDSGWGLIHLTEGELYKVEGVNEDIRTSSIIIKVWTKMKKLSWVHFHRFRIVEIEAAKGRCIILE